MAKIRKFWISREEFKGIMAGEWVAPTTIDFTNVVGLTTGSIPFADASGFLAEDNANLFWDAAEANLGIGTATFGATMTQGIQIATGLAPTANVADTFAFYSADFAAGNACPHFRTENGTVIGLNQSLLTTDSLVFVGLTLSGAGGAGLLLSSITSTIDFTGGAGEKGILYKDTGGTVRFAMRFPAGSDVVEILNRAANGTVEIHANTAVAGAGGDVKVAEFQDDAISFLVNLTLINEGLHILDTNASHDLVIKAGSDLTADRILSLVTGDAARTITLQGDPTLGDWFDQAVKQASTPTLAGLIIANGGTIRCVGAPIITFDDTNDKLMISGCNVGLGTTNPALVDNLLTLYGQFSRAKFLSSTVEGCYFTFVNSDTTSTGYYGIEGNTAGTIFTGSTANSVVIGGSGNLHFYGNGAVRATMDLTGAFLMPNLKRGANQGAVGAVAGELWVDSADETIKRGT